MSNDTQALNVTLLEREKVREREREQEKEKLKRERVTLPLGDFISLK